MKKLIFFTATILFAAGLVASPTPNENGYKYKLDLVNVQNDRVGVELIVPKMDKAKATFYFPKIIPGTYSIYDFGRFVHDLQAFDQEGNELPVKRKDINTWQIKGAKKLHKLTYQVDDTFDATGGKPVSGMSGTNIEADKNFLLNGHGFYGYFKDMKFLPFEVTVDKPDGFAHQSAYQKVAEENGKDVFTANDYHHLVDMPVMYCKPDTAIVKLDKTDVLISVYSPNKEITSDFLREKYTRLLHSQKDYLDGKLPVDRYAFLMYFMGEQLPIGTGALEHNYSSVYCLPEMNRDQIAPFLVDIASHEFFHIITPLNVHSKEIHYFDFNKPKMSRHLWMYEGITEYFSHHNQVRSGMITKEQFFQRMGQKVQNSKSTYDDDLPFTKMSQGCLGKHEHQYGNVYEKGALIGMCIDIELHRLSNGQYGVVDLMADLSEKYGSQKPFNDKHLFREVTNLTYPEIGNFLKKYIAGNTPIPYEEFLAKAGVEYIPPKDTLVYGFGDASFNYNQETQRLIVTNTYNMNAMGHELGYKVGDELLSINGNTVPPTGIREFFGEVRKDMREGEPIKIVVVRKDENGETKEVPLTATIKRSKRVFPPEIKLMEKPTPEQLAVREAWLGS